MYVPEGILTFLTWSFPAWAHSPSETTGDTTSAPVLIGAADALFLLFIASATILFFTGLRTMQIRAGKNRIISPWRTACFTTAVLAMTAATLLHRPSEELAWIHMIQHMMIMMIAAPLLAFARPSFVMLWAFPETVRQFFNRLSRRWHSPLQPLTYLLLQPVFVWLFYALILWTWHWPRFYEAALHNRWIHEVQHFGFFLSSFLFAKVLLDPVVRKRLNRGLALIYLFTTSVHASLLGFFMTLSPIPWYEEYARTAPLHGYSPLEDQQLAGAIMWMPACTAYVVLAVFTFVSWLNESSREQRCET